MLESETTKGGIVLQRTCYIPSLFGNLLPKTVIGADGTGKPPLRFLLLLHSSLTPLPGQWDCHQSCKYTVATTFVIISQNFLIAHHKSFGHVTITHHNTKHVLWHLIVARVAFYSWPGLYIYTIFIFILTVLFTNLCCFIFLLYLIAGAL